MLINTPDGWRSITGKPAPAIREAATAREVSAKMADELAQLCPSLGAPEASRIASAMLGQVRGAFGVPLGYGFAA